MNRDLWPLGQSRLKVNTFMDKYIRRYIFIQFIVSVFRKSPPRLRVRAALAANARADLSASVRANIYYKYIYR